MIPKAYHAPHVFDYRPISYCTVIYKIISKVLASRLRWVMGSILDQAQVAYVDDRSIVENIHLVQELLKKYARKRSSPRYVLKVDLQKAFDTVDWSFLLVAMWCYGIPEQYDAWIAECITTVTYSVSINGGVWILQREAGLEAR